MPELASDAPVTALMEIGVSCRLVSLFKAVTTTSSIPLEAGDAASAVTPGDWAAAQPVQPDSSSAKTTRRAALKLLVITLPLRHGGAVRSYEQNIRQNDRSTPYIIFRLKGS